MAFRFEPQRGGPNFLRIVILVAASLLSLTGGAFAQPSSEPAGPNIVLDSVTFEVLPDGKENRLSGPRVTTRPGQEATIMVFDGQDYFQFTVLPDWTNGKISIECAYEDGKVNLPPASHPKVRPRPGELVPLAPVKRPPTLAKSAPTPEPKTKARGSRPFPDNLTMTGFVKIPGKPPRISLKDLNEDDEFWVELGGRRRGVRFVSVDFSIQDPRALVEQDGKFAEVRLSSPVLKPVKPPALTAERKFSFTDVVEPGEKLLFDIGTSRNGHPQKLRLSAREQNQKEPDALNKRSREAR